jgi:hypothetical protein
MRPLQLGGEDVLIGFILDLTAILWYGWSYPCSKG